MPRPAAGKLATSPPPVLIQIAGQEPGGERLPECSIHHEGAMHATYTAYYVRPKQHSRTNVAELRRQAKAPVWLG
jgi:hypothetical protein